MPTPLPPALAALERRLGVPEGTLEAEDKARAEDALDDATALALAEVSSATGARWTEDAPAVVLVTILRAARREFENPSGLSQEALGERSVSGMDTSGVFLTAREIRQIQRAEDGRRGGRIGSIRLSTYRDA